MPPGFIMLAHERLDRAAAVAASLAGQGAPVVVHLDQRTPAEDAARFGRDTGPGVTVISTRRGEWGQFGLVDATLDAAAALFECAPGITHVALVSGSCLPIRPVAELEAHLAAQPGTEFIESVPLARDQWVVDGLSWERLTLWHPFSHRRTPRLFSASVEVQRRLGISRRLPGGLAAHLGRQWWCLGAETLRAILDDPRLAAWRRFFRHSWIPDESFFQTVVRAARPEADIAGTLHLAEFNNAGRPHVFHDDHRDLLAGSDAFFARKIDPDAGGLYRHFLPVPPRSPRRPVDRSVFDITPAREGRGTLGQARYPSGTSRIAVDSPAPYLVVVTDGNTRLDPGALAARQDTMWLGRLFGPGRVRYPGGKAEGPGNLPSAPRLRDYRPAQFLARLVGAVRPRKLAFHYCPGDNGFIDGQVLGDGYARLVFLAGTAEEAEALLHRMQYPPDRWGHPLWAWYRIATGPGEIADLAGHLYDPDGWVLQPGAELVEAPE